MMKQHFDALEIRDPAEREAAQLAALPRLIAHAQQHSPAATHTLAGINAANVNSWAALASLPVTRKHALLERQLATRPADSFGGFASVVRGRKMPRIFASPGPIYEPDVARPDYWRLGRALYAAGFREGDLTHNSFSYHMTPGAFMMESGAHAIGCSVFPAGTGQTEQQLAAIADLRPEAYVGTPSFLRILLEKAHASGSDISSIQRALVSGEAFPPSLRDWLESHGIAGYQCYVTADLGLIAYETEARQGLVLDEGVLVEIVRPGTGDPLPAGEVGELVVTTLNPDYPLIRFGTGDLSAVLPGTCPTGRSNTRIKGWLGRADQITKVRGMFVHPGQIAEIVKRFPEVLKARLVVSGEMANDAMTLKLEVSAAPDGLAARIGEAVRDVTKLRSDVDLISPGNLPNDGLVIEDARSYK
jgi:phenylacetate-CoA ligase